MKARVWLGILLAAGGCTCDNTSKRRSPVIEVIDAEGTERTSIDFGTVQVNVTHQRTLRVRNGGAIDLNISALEAAAPFGYESALPITLGVAEEVQLVVTYRPERANQRHSGKLVISSDDPNRPSVAVDLFGSGIQAVAVASPNPINFGDVHLRESAKLTLTLTNAGSNELDIQQAQLSADAPAPPVLSANLSSLVGKVAPGGSASVELTFAPTELGPLKGTLEVTLDPLQGGKLSLPLQGRGVSAKPSVCFQFDGEGTAQCSDPELQSPSLQLRFPPLCDNRVFPPGSPNACTAATGEKKGRLFFRNDGNVPVSYSVQYVPYPHPANRCDAGYPVESDFRFSNAPTQPDGGVPTSYTQGTTQLPLNASDPTPWESAPITVTYHAASRCRDEAADQARLVWTRQGELQSTRYPHVILVTMDGTSQLPRALNVDWNCGTIGSPQSVPCKYIFYGVSNAGSAPLTVRSVELWEELPNLPDGGMGGGDGPNGGAFQKCTFTNPYSDCLRFAWDAVDGGDPNQHAPHVLPASPNPPQQTQKVLGTLVFGPNGAGDCFFDGGACPNQLYKLYAVVETDDPYSPKVISRLQGVAAPPK